MVISKAPSVEDYLDELPEDRRKAISTVRKVILKNLPKGYKESMEFGMIGYGIPLEKYPDTYNGHPLCIAGLASQKNYMSVYLMGVYATPKMEKWFKTAYAASGKKLNMGKCCVRFKKAEDLPLDLIGETIAKFSVKDFIELYETSRRKVKK